MSELDGDGVGCRLQVLIGQSCVAFSYSSSFEVTCVVGTAFARGMAEEAGRDRARHMPPHSLPHSLCGEAGWASGGGACSVAGAVGVEVGNRMAPCRCGGRCLVSE